MLRITISAREIYDEQNNMFISIDEQELQLEHSLVSLSKWESKWCKPFYTKEPKTLEETIDYIRCMTVTENVDPIVYSCLSEKNVSEINSYIEHPMTATTFSNMKSKAGKNNGERVTSELIYYWMIAFNIPVEFEHWHLNRLLTLIQVCEIKNEPPKKMSKHDVMSRNAALNAARRKQMNSSG